MWCVLDVNGPAWIQHDKHIFLLSEAGKPIYCRYDIQSRNNMLISTGNWTLCDRYGSEDKLVTLMGVMQALISFVQDEGDTLK